MKRLILVCAILLLPLAAFSKVTKREKEACFLSPSYACVITQALAIAKTTEDADDRAEALTGIATAQAKAGEVKAALATAKTIEDADDRAEALTDIATAQAKAGDVNAALATTKTIENVYWRASALTDIAEILFQIK